MISDLLQIADAAVGASLPVTTRHVYATLAGGQPVVHVGDGNHVPVANDMTGYWSYQRIRGEVSAAHAQVAGDPCLAVRLTVPLRIVALLDKDTCIDHALRLVAALKGSSQEAQVATKAFAVEFERITWSFDQLAGQEFNPLPQIPVHRTLLVVDCTVQVTGSAACLSDCDPVDVTCALIQSATLERIRECLGDRINELCEGGGPCDPLNYSLRNSQGTTLLSGIEQDPCGKELPLVAPDGTVLRDGQPFGTVPSGGSLNVPSSCEPCPLDVTINDTPFATVDDPCSTPALNIEVENEDGSPVGTNVDGVWVVPTAKSLCTLIQEAETTEAITDCIISAGKRPAVQCVLLGATDAGDVVDEVYDCLTAGAQTAMETAICSREVFLRFQFEAQDNQSVTFTIDADSAGTYTALTQDGSSGTITVSINGGAYGAFVNPTALAIGDTIAVQRTSFASLGFVKITGTY